MIGRKRKKAAPAQEDEGHLSPAADTPPKSAPPEPQLSQRDGGPHDITEVEQQDPHEASRLDLGALQLPLIEQMEIRIEVDPESEEPVGLLVVLQDGMAQLRIFAAPRSGGGWAESREQIRRSLTGGGATIDERDGEFGAELHATVQVTDDEGRTGMQRMRFIGIDGPRWMLQATLYGAGALPEQAGPLEDVVRSVVVVRGDAAMPPGTPLLLTLPERVPDNFETTIEGGDDAQ
jgi:hypothetical protein